MHDAIVIELGRLDRTFGRVLPEPDVVSRRAQELCNTAQLVGTFRQWTLLIHYSQIGRDRRVLRGKADDRRQSGPGRPARAEPPDGAWAGP